MKTVPKQHRPKLRWWQVLVRAALAIVLVAIMVWVALPWWLPKEMLRRKLAEDLSGQMGVEVNISALTISWAGGVEITGLTIASPEGFHQDAAGPMIEIERMRCDFSPMDMLLAGRVDWLEIVQPRLRVLVDREGNINLAALKKLRPNISAQRISLSDAEISVQLPDHKRDLIFRIGNLELQQGKLNQIGRVTMTASLRQQDTIAPMSLRVSSSQLKPNAAIEAAFNFANLDLSQIPLPSSRAPLPIRSLEGRCSGRLSFKISSNLQVEQLSLELLARKLKVTPAGTPPLPIIDEAGLRLAAAVDSASERVNLSSIHLRLPGLDITGSAGIYADILTEGFDAVETFDLQGMIQPGQVAAMLTGQAELPGELEVTGQIAMNVLGLRGDEVFSLKSTACADEIVVRRGLDVLKPAGRKMRLQLEADLRQLKNSWVCNLQRGRLALGKNTLTATATTVFPQLLQSGRGILQTPLQKTLRAIESIRARGTVEIVELDVLRNLLPRQERGKLQFDGVLNGTWSIAGGKNSRILASLRAGAETKLRFGELLVKPHGQEMAIDAALVANAGTMKLRKVSLECSAGESWAGIDETRIQLPGMGRDLKIEGNFKINGVEHILACLPGLMMDNVTLTRSIDGDFVALFAGNKTDITCTADLHRLAIRAGEVFAKPPGKAMEVTAKIEGRRQSSCETWTVTARAKTPQARLDTQLKHRTQNGKEAVSLVIGANISDAAWLAELSPALTRVLRGAKLDGKINIAGRAEKSQNKIEFLLACESDELNCLDGAPGHRLNIHSQPFVLKVKGSLEEKTSPKGGKNQKLSALHLRDFRVQLGELHLNADARAELLGSGNGLPVAVKPAEAHLAVWTNRAETLGEIVPAWKRYAPAGDFFADIMWTASADDVDKIVAQSPPKIVAQPPSAGGDTGTISTATFYARNLRGEYRGRGLAASGTVLLENVRLSGKKSSLGRFHTDDLELRAGKNHGWLLADICSAASQPRGEFHVLLEYLDVKDLTDWLSSPAGKTVAGPLGEKQRKNLSLRADAIIASLNKVLEGADIRGRISAGTFGIFDEKVGQHYLTQQFELDMTADSGKCDLTYMTGVCGGCARGRLGTRLGEKAPCVASHVEFASVISTPSIQPQIMLYFPDNTVSGTFSRDEYVTYPLRDMIANSIDSRYRLIPVGEAKMVATDGVVVGRSAPKFVTKVFPGLNLTKYPYKTMTGYSKFLPDGSAENEMFFFGAYDLYMEGVTDVDNFVKYTVGLVLFGSTFSPEALRDWKQGRIPLIKVKGRIHGGKLIDDEVSYPLPNETLFEIFLRNNFVYRAWVNISRKPDTKPPELP